MKRRIADLAKEIITKVIPQARCWSISHIVIAFIEQYLERARKHFLVVSKLAQKSLLKCYFCHLFYFFIFFFFFSLSLHICSSVILSYLSHSVYLGNIKVFKFDKWKQRCTFILIFTHQLEMVKKFIANFHSKKNSVKTILNYVGKSEKKIILLLKRERISLIF